MVIGLVNIYPAPLDSGAVVPVEDQWEGGGASTAHAHAGCRGDTQEQHRGGHSGENQTQCPLFPSHSPPHLPMVSSRLCVPLTHTPSPPYSVLTFVCSPHTHPLTSLQCPHVCVFPSHSPPHLPTVSSRLCVPLTPPPPSPPYSVHVCVFPSHPPHLPTVSSCLCVPLTPPSPPYSVLTFVCSPHTPLTSLQCPHVCVFPSHPPLPPYRATT